MVLQRQMLTLDDAMRMAATLAAAGEQAEAVRVLRQIHAHRPDDPAVIHALGVCLVNDGKLEDALPYFQALLQGKPTVENALLLLRVLRELRRIPEMEQVCAALCGHLPDDPELLGIRGYACLQMGQLDKAEEILRRGLAMAPDDTRLLHNLSATLMMSGRGEDAVAVCSRMARPWTGERHHRDLVEEYGTLASGYDDNQLHHQFSETLLRFVGGIRPGWTPDAILELGCGSGLLSTVIGHAPRRFVGVDLSPHMLALAEGRGRYTQLLRGDLVEVMAGLTGPFDAILSAGVFCYLPDLEAVFGGASRLLGPGGVFAFAVDPVTDHMEVGVSAAGEYFHSRRYLRRLAARAGLTELGIEIANHRGLPGFWCAFGRG